MHHAQAYVINHWRAPYVNRIVTARDEVQLAKCLDADAADYTFSSLVSLADALSGIRQGFFSWSTVKLYYSVFYALRAFLAVNLFASSTKVASLRALMLLWVRLLLGCQVTRTRLFSRPLRSATRITV